MLTDLSIRDVVLIDRLDLSFGPGLTVLTGETGAGKSILLDSLGLALGARAEASLVRAGTSQAIVAASFAPPVDHPAYAELAEHGLAAEDGIVLRRIVAADGRSRAYVNEQPVGVALLRRLGSLLVEVQGQHEQMGLADPATHAGLLDAYDVPADLRQQTAQAWAQWHAARAALSKARADIEAAAREEDWLRHAVDELGALAPQEGEESALAAERQTMQQSERRGEAIAAALAELTPRDRRSAGPAAALRAAFRALDRLTPDQGGTQSGPVLDALSRAEEALAEAETLLSRLAQEAEADPRRLEQTEERLFALRAAARKHNIAVVDLPELLAKLSARLQALETGSAHIAALEEREAQARHGFEAAAGRLSAERHAAAGRLAAAVSQELPPLRLDKARFHVEVTALPEPAWSAGGIDNIRFLIATNPGQTPGPLARVASGGELSRLMLALKVVLAAGSVVPTMVFDEVDSGIGGATAASVGERLARVATRLQVLVVTHSPQVAARGLAHLQVAKRSAKGRAETLVLPLDRPARREEIARMLAGEFVTEAARAAADALLSQVA